MSHFIPLRNPAEGEEQALLRPQDGTPPTPEEVVVFRLRRLFASERDSAVVTAERIHQTVSAAGRATVDQALGSEAGDLGTLYAALQAFITTLDPSIVVPNLPDP
jgi:hypothetical protein